MRKVIYYKTANGECPVDDFLNSLSTKQFEKVTWVLSIIRELPLISRQYFKKLVNTDDIWEVRIDSGSDTFRILGFMEKGNFVILTNGFTKKTEKTPPNEIKLAEKRKKDYESRRNG
ncbi:MAG TPA: type II toxin-antitoxin system RelE/ParE family toxin [Pyrinomonadaceae bacterium]|nr:type II toxin-antitoxin system RelE/ParE family toxin [Pyrinomonadaceae bacterium]